MHHGRSFADERLVTIGDIGKVRICAEKRFRESSVLIFLFRFFFSSLRFFFRLNAIDSRSFCLRSGAAHHRDSWVQFVKDFGLEADRHLLRCLFSAVDFSCSPGRSGDATTPGHSRSNSTSSSNSNNNNYYSSGPLSLQARLLSTELVGLLTKPQLVGNVCFAVDNPLPQQRVRNFACFD